MATAVKKVLLLRSAEGKVLMAPTWDARPFAHFLPPLETGAPTRALEKVIEHWTAHNRAAARGCCDGILWKWDLQFVRRLCEEEGLPEEAYAAAMLLQRQDLADLIRLVAHSRSRPRPDGKEYYVDLDPDDKEEDGKKGDDVVAEEAAESAATARPATVSPPATPPRPVPATRRLRRKVSACRGPPPARKVLSSRVHPLRRKNTASTVSPATSNPHG